MHRNRASGTYQSGRIDGIRATLQRIKPCSIYAAADYLFATGDLKGTNSRDFPIHSTLTDQIFEVRLGYCLQSQKAPDSFFVPFGGWGLFQEINDHYLPTPIPYTFTDQFHYIVVGFLSGIDLLPYLNVGINFKTMFMEGALSKITDDPDFDDTTVMIRNVPYFRLELPCILRLCGNWPFSGFKITPFYEYRHFGGRAGYPFDFIDTTFNLFGLSTSLIFTY